jgi:anti-sigma28 factor (negative regulator of flagellin synthesis)
MFISRAELASAVSSYRTVKRTSAATAASVETGDSFDPSEAAASLGELVASATSEPFYRPALVERLRRQISDGRYHVSTDQIVERLLGRLFLAAAF